MCILFEKAIEYENLFSNIENIFDKYTEKEANIENEDEDEEEYKVRSSYLNYHINIVISIIYYLKKSFFRQNLPKEGTDNKSRIKKRVKIIDIT
jgi:hypothetical protein